jgi:hypothetical protein
LKPYNTRSIYEGVVDLAGKDVKVTYHEGCQTFRTVPTALFKEILQGKFTMEVFNGDPASDPNLKPVKVIETVDTHAHLADGFEDVDRVCWINFSAKIKPLEDGEYTFGIAACGGIDLYIDGQRLIENSTNLKVGLHFDFSPDSYIKEI